MDLFNGGLALLLAAVGVYVTVKRMKTATQKKIENAAVFAMVVGVAMMIYGLMVRGESGDKKPSASVEANVEQANPSNSPVANQTMTDSPGGVQIQGNHNTVNQGVQPRKLTPEQEVLFVQILKDNPKGHVEIDCVESGGPEPCDFARQLGRLLESRDAGWTVTFSPIMLGAGDPTKIIPALYLQAQSEKPSLSAFALREALKAVLGHDPDCFVDPNQPPNYLRLTVWHNRP